MVDILAIGAHPDDVELSCSGTLLKQKGSGYTIGLLDLSLGEMGTRGTPEIRKAESLEAAEKMGALFRWNAELPDGFMNPYDRNSVSRVAAYIRKAQPKLVLANAPADRHPDHGRAAEIAKEAFFLAGLRSLRLEMEGAEMAAWRPNLLLHYIQDRHLIPDFVVDITPHIQAKMELIKCFKSQFFDPDSREPETPISTESFMEQMVGKARTYGRYCGAEFGEGFISSRPPGVEDINLLV
ncbi:MAG: bacillithiol biosynthesis deacetylase BshB1 [Saprospirales bacterium]|nr:MAG: bacillithiol biosynthesis deacetylase BshB1 [Saprospirales bacterium]